MFSLGGSSFWAEAYRALGPGDSGLSSSLYPRAPQRPGRKGVPGAHDVGKGRHGYDRGARILFRERPLNLLCQNTKNEI